MFGFGVNVAIVCVVISVGLHYVGRMMEFENALNVSGTLYVKYRTRLGLFFKCQS